MTITDKQSSDISWHSHTVTKEQREKIKNQRSCVLWFTGLSGSGKSTIANSVEVELYERNYHTYLLDGDNIRHGLNSDLGFDEKDRAENIRRISEVSKLFCDAGIIVLTAFISPFIADREEAKKVIGEDNFIEIFIDAPFDECSKRDPKGLYKKALNAEIKNFTGLDSPYEAPLKADIHIKTDIVSVQESTQEIIKYLQTAGFLPC